MGNEHVVDTALNSTESRPVDTSFAVLEISSIALGYSALGLVTRNDSIRILDASPYGLGWFQIQLQGPKQALEEVLHSARGQLDGSAADVVRDQILIENINPALLQSLFSLAQVELEESLVVIETQTTSAGMSLAQLLVNSHGLKAIDLKVQRGSKGGLIGYFTGPSEKVGPAAEDARTHLKSSLREGHIEVIDKPSRSFRRFFNLNGND